MPERDRATDVVAPESGVLRNLGHELGRNTIKRILDEHGLAPALKRGRTRSGSAALEDPGSGSSTAAEQPARALALTLAMAVAVAKVGA